VIYRVSRESNETGPRYRILSKGLPQIVNIQRRPLECRHSAASETSEVYKLLVRPFPRSVVVQSWHLFDCRRLQCNACHSGPCWRWVTWKRQVGWRPECMEARVSSKPRSVPGRTSQWTPCALEPFRNQFRTNFLHFQIFWNNFIDHRYRHRSSAIVLNFRRLLESRSFFTWSSAEHVGGRQERSMLSIASLPLLQSIVEQPVHLGYLWSGFFVSLLNENALTLRFCLGGFRDVTTKRKGFTRRKIVLHSRVRGNCPVVLPLA